MPNIEATRATYVYDAFISYPFDALGKFWVGEHFIPELMRAAPHSPFGDSLKLATTADIIGAGDNWKAKLGETISRSACLIAVVSYAYRNSEWCCWEWRCFSGRGKPATSKKHIVPILTWGDIETLQNDLEPPLDGLKDLQIANYGEWCFDVANIRVQAYYPHFQTAALKLANDLYAMLGRVAPCPDKGWPLAKGPIPSPRSTSRLEGAKRLPTMTWPKSSKKKKVTR
jgi:TIR domain